MPLHLHLTNLFTTGAPSYVHHIGKKHEIGGMKRILEGPVMVAFATMGKMQAFFLRKCVYCEQHTVSSPAVRAPDGQL